MKRTSRGRQWIMIQSPTDIPKCFNCRNDSSKCLFGRPVKDKKFVNRYEAVMMNEFGLWSLDNYLSCLRRFAVVLHS